jgi:hypothetical protein
VGNKRRIQRELSQFQATQTVLVEQEMADLQEVTNDLARMPQPTASRGERALRIERDALQTDMDDFWTQATGVQNIVSSFHCGG